MIAFWDGEYKNAEDCFVSVLDRGYYFGDGAYEGLSAYNGVCFALEEHVDRMSRSLKELEIEAPYSKSEMMDIVRKGVAESGKQELFIYFQITRGCAVRRHAYQEGMKGNFLMFAIDRPNYSKLRSEGASLISVPDERWRRCDIKSLNLLANVMAAKKASDKGAIDALLVRDGAAAECAAHNVFRVKDGVVYTEPESSLILSGIGRKHVLAIAKELGFKTVQTHSTIEDFYESDEVFLTSCVALVLPVVYIDGRKVGPSHPVSDALYQKYLTKIEDVCGKPNESLI